MDPTNQIIRVGDPAAPAPAGMGRAAPAAPGRRQPPALSGGPDGLALLRALRRRWVLALLVGLGLAAVAGPAAWYLVPAAKYTARATLRVASAPPKVVFTTADSAGSQDETVRYQKTQAALIKSRYVLNAALKQLLVEEAEAKAKVRAIAEVDDPMDWLEREVNVKFAEGSELLVISLGADHAEDAAKIVQAVRDAYLKEVVNVEKTRRLARRDTLEKFYKQYQDGLLDKRKRLRVLAESVGSNNQQTLALKQQLALDQQAAAEKERMDVKGQLRRAQAELAVEEARARAGARAEPGEAEVARLVEQEPGVAEARERLGKARVALDRMRDLLRGVARRPAESDPAWPRLHREYEAAEQALRARRAQARPMAVDFLRKQAGESRTANVGVLREKVALLKSIERQIEEELGRKGEQQRAETKMGLDLQSIQDEIAQSEEAAKKIGAELEALKVELDAPDRITPLEPRVEVPYTRDEKQRLLMIAGATLGALAAGVLGISLWEFRSRRIDSADEVIAGLGMRLVGTLPALPERSRRTSGAAAGAGAADLSRRVLLESIDATRTMILHAARTESLRVVMITSAVGGEGKTSLACHLATSLARAGLRTLLVDCDLRCPAAHRVFDAPPAPGLADLLGGDADADEAIRPTPVDRLDLLPVGRRDARTFQELACGGTRAVFDALRGRYDLIVVDSSPVLPVADSLLIAQQVDAVLFSIMRDVSRAPRVYAAYERLASLGVRMLGAVVTGMRGDLYGPDYRYQYAGVPDEADAPGGADAGGEPA